MRLTLQEFSIACQALTGRGTLWAAKAASENEVDVIIGPTAMHDTVLDTSVLIHELAKPKLHGPVLDLVNIGCEVQIAAQTCWTRDDPLHLHLRDSLAP